MENKSNQSEIDIISILLVLVVVGVGDGGGKIASGQQAQNVIDERR